MNVCAANIIYVFCETMQNVWKLPFAIRWLSWFVNNTKMAFSPKQPIKNTSQGTEYHSGEKCDYQGGRHRPHIGFED